MQHTLYHTTELKHKYTTGSYIHSMSPSAWGRRGRFGTLPPRGSKQSGLVNTVISLWCQLPAERQPCPTTSLQQEQTTFGTFTERYLQEYRKPVTSKGSGWLQTYLRPFKLPPEVSPWAQCQQQLQRSNLMHMHAHPWPDLKGDWEQLCRVGAGGMAQGWAALGLLYHTLPQTFLLELTSGIFNGNRTTSVPGDFAFTWREAMSPKV